MESSEELTAAAQQEDAESSDDALNDSELLFRAVAATEVKWSATRFGKGVSSAVFFPDLNSTAFSPTRPRIDQGKLSTEHESTPGGANGFLSRCALTNIAGIWGVEVGEARSCELVVEPDGRADPELSDWHVSLDFAASGQVNDTFRVTARGRRTARELAKLAGERGPLTPINLPKNGERGFESAQASGSSGGATREQVRRSAGSSIVEAPLGDA